MNDFKYTSCDNSTCKEHLNCKRYKMFTMGATDTKKGSGNANKECKRFLAIKNK